MDMRKRLAAVLITALVSLGVQAQQPPTLVDRAVARHSNLDEPTGLLACDRPSCAEALAVFCAIRVDRDGLLIGPIEATEETKSTLAACRKAAELGSASAQWSMATIDGMARGPSNVDYRATLNWLVPSAEHGYADAQSELGVMYLSGRGVEKDSVEAYKWLKLSAWKNSQNDKFANDLAVTMSTDEVREARALVNSWRPK
ncbi:sel1 repeat family protein [Burkholderia vietnamiensis]|uniref:tetratricopeptide repeat protein n=1 Tax=Burkholderia vietnamiensis TaxID=60552 RepID=UPI001B910294|nr:tetratricopeptide repeat protein [Burkholderia vietnamiensis]MBR7972839.1 sel1 repeat family protein [Burkholderia vietnamiensis]